ncbi:MAG: hypothetical protein WA709_01340 [Stellaceae bacterium]
MAFCASGYLGRAREGTGYEPAPDQLGWACPIYVAETDARAREEARNNIYVFGIRGEGKSATHRAAALMAQKRFDAKMIHTHTFSLAEVPTAIKYARERIDGAIKVVVKIREN